MLSNTFKALRHKNFRLFFFGQFVSLIGTWMQSVAQGWLVLQLSNSALVLGIVGACGHLPTLLFSFWGGSFADRRSKRRIILTTQAIACFLAFTLGSLVIFEMVKVWHVATAAFVMGTVMSFDLPARQSFLIEMVGKDDLANAIGLNSSIFNAARLIGPGIAGFIIANLGIGMCYLLNGVSFLAVIAGLIMMQETAVSKPSGSRTQQGLREFAWDLRGEEEVACVLLLVAASSLLIVPYSILLPMFARDTLQVGAKGLGFLLAANGMGALSGALISASIPVEKRKMWHLFSHSIVFALSIFIFSFCQSYRIALIVLGFAGISMVGFFTSANAFVQLNIAHDKRGRVMGLYSVAFLGVVPFGSLLSGSLAQHIGVPGAIKAGTAAFVLISGLVWTSLKKRWVGRQNGISGNVTSDP